MLMSIFIILVGHGEREVPYTFIETIGKGGFTVDELSIMKEKDIPEDASSSTRKRTSQ